ncbi:hypothetical protein [Cytobacillus horneckiae]|uniref:hypothetical protein n=1 Tax=Cytobacillus horneckiae TaxID=549687 RepID=UPI002041E202|nr:hypothetical protein [Cytobacillus horneckiae]MCM3180605.1 hypothetical protein [Cytobacillus horneckiae]
MDLNDIFPIISFVVVIIYFISKHKEVLKKLSNKQKLGMAVSYIAAISGAASCIIIGGKFLKSVLSNQFVITIFGMALIVVTLFITSFILNIVIKKLTGGQFDLTKV